MAEENSEPPYLLTASIPIYTAGHRRRYLYWPFIALTLCKLASGEQTALTVGSCTDPSFQSLSLGEYSQCELSPSDSEGTDSAVGQALLQSTWGTHRQSPDEQSQGELAHELAEWIESRIGPHTVQQMAHLHQKSVHAHTHLKVPWMRPVMLWSAAILAVAVLGSLLFGWTAVAPDDETGAPGRTQWNLIVASFLVMMNSGSVYAMGAWQDELRDALGLSMEQVTAVGASTFLGILVSTFGGFLFDRLGPRAAVALGGIFSSLGYLLIGLAVVAAHSLEVYAKFGLAAAGSLMVGYSSVSLMDNIVCTACSLSFPSERAAVVGLLKAALATSAGFWALLWVHVFRGDLGLASYLAVTGFAILGVTLLCLPGITIIYEGSRHPFYKEDWWRYAALVLGVAMMSCFDVAISFLYSRSLIFPHPVYPMVSMLLALLPVGSIMAQTRWRTRDGDEVHCVKTAGESNAKGTSFSDAILGLDFWLLFFVQYAVFGAGVAINQNLALVMESVGAKEASGLGVALFALTSSLSRMGAGVLSDWFKHIFSRLGWITSTMACTVLGLCLLSIMNLPAIMVGVLLIGLSFGAFYTLFPPVVNEMYGARNIGKILMTQLCCQAASALSISIVLLPTLYRRAAGEEAVCTGPACFRRSFLILASIGAVALLAALCLQKRRAHMPLAQ